MTNRTRFIHFPQCKIRGKFCTVQYIMETTHAFNFPDKKQPYPLTQAKLMIKGTNKESKNSLIKIPLHDLDIKISIKISSFILLLNPEA